MKSTFSRRYRRRSSPSRDTDFAKKDNQQEQPFFSPASPQSFFKPNAAILRKCAHCEAEEKKVNRSSDMKEEDKKVQKKEINRKQAPGDEEKKVQKMEGPKEEEKKVQKMEAPKEEEKKLHRSEDKKEEKEVQRAMDEKEKDKIVSKNEASQKPSEIDAASGYISNLDGKGQPLSNDTKRFFAERLGHDFDGVRIHTDAGAQQSAKDINAKAYAVDKHIVFAKNQFNPASDEGKKLLAHELVHVIQNNPANAVKRKPVKPEEEKETHVNISGSVHQAKGKKAFGGCNLPPVHGQTDFATLPSSYKVKGAKTKASTECESCVAPECIASIGSIESKFKSKIKVTLPLVPSGLSKCEAAAVSRFIQTTLNNHEQEHVTAFKTYNGTVKTPYEFNGCKADLAGYIQSIHQGIDSQRATDAIAQSDALDPFVREIPCNCE